MENNLPLVLKSPREEKKIEKKKKRATFKIQVQLSVEYSSLPHSPNSQAL